MFLRRNLVATVVLPAMVAVVRRLARMFPRSREAVPLANPFAGLPEARRLELSLRAVWRAAAEAAGLTEIEESGPEEASNPSAGPWLEGDSGRLRVRLFRPSSSVLASTRITIAGLGHGFDDLRVRSGWSEARTQGQLRSTGIRLGVQGFDDAFVIEGRPELALGLLDSPTRGLLRELFHESAWTAALAEDRLLLELRFLFTVSPAELGERLSRTLGRALELAHRLEMPEDLLARLARNLPAEPEAGVRQRSVRLLVKGSRGHEAAAAALRAALDDADEQVRLEAAMACGTEGQATLKALAASAGSSEATKVRAIGALGAALSVEEAVALAKKELQAERVSVVLACVKTIGRHGHFGQPGNTVAESLLATLLPRASVSLAFAAATALGKLGTAAAVPALRAAEARGARDLTRAARQAIAEIQARLTGAEAGQLSLSAGAGGALSLVEQGEAGRVSLVGEDGAKGERD